MPSKNSPAILVARFLQANRYEETLAAYLLEAGLPEDAGSVEPGDITIESVLEEKKIFDLSLKFEKIGVGEDGDKGWISPAPRTSTFIESLPSSSNVLHVSMSPISSLKDGREGLVPYIFLTTADKRINILSTEPSYPLIHSLGTLHDSPVLSTSILQNKYLLSSSMSGQVHLTSLSTMEPLSTRRDHTKYVVKTVSHKHEETIWIATAGWDQKVMLYKLDQASPSSPPRLSNPIATLTLPTNPEDIIFLPSTASRPLTLLLTRRDDAHLHYYSIPTLKLLGTQNLAPHSNAWISFSPSSIALSPSDPSLLAVGTSSLPYMKLLFVRLLFPAEQSSNTTTPPQPETQTSQSRLALEIATREEEAILTHASTGAPQTPYSTPQVCWRPNGSGVWVNGDDGVVRGLEYKSGRVVEVLRGGHEAGSKIRSICAGVLGDGKECVLSGGFDRKAIVWSVGEERRD